MRKKLTLTAKRTCASLDRCCWAIKKARLWPRFFVAIDGVEAFSGEDLINGAVLFNGAVPGLHGLQCGGT